MRPETGGPVNTSTVITVLVVIVLVLLAVWLFQAIDEDTLGIALPWH